MKQIRNTAQKQLIKDLLVGNTSHPTADEVYELARQKNPSISRGTVYRNLNNFAEDGEILKVMTPIGPDHYDFNTQNHYHFLCKNCRKMIDTDFEYDQRLNEISPQGCKTEWHKLLFVGLCDKCMNKDYSNQKGEKNEFER